MTFPLIIVKIHVDRKTNPFRLIKRKCLWLCAKEKSQKNIVLCFVMSQNRKLKCTFICSLFCNPDILTPFSGSRNFLIIIKSVQLWLKIPNELFFMNILLFNDRLSNKVFIKLLNICLEYWKTILLHITIVLPIKYEINHFQIKC